MSDDESDFEWDGVEVPLDPGVTPELFREWRSPRFGKTNPERMSNPIWQWIIKSRMNAYQVNQRLEGPDAFESGPGWCFTRFGRSSTTLADGRAVLIAGEHEDSCAPDFYIYNDVVVKHPDGRLDIFGYPREVFEPTDFHSATLAGDRIVIIGNLSYPDVRKPGFTPVMVLDLATFAMTAAESTGTPPSWIHRHTAALAEDGRSILVSGGKVEKGDRFGLSENVDEWRLNLADWRWERLTERPWQQWLVRRSDRQWHHLYDIERSRWWQNICAEAGGNERWKKEVQDSEDSRFSSLVEELGARPNLEVFDRLYRPNIEHQEVPRIEGEYNIHRVKVDGVVVKYVQELHQVHLRVEGELPQATIDLITRDLAQKMATLENAPCELRQI